MNRFRYWLFKQVNRVNWWIIPEPQRSLLYRDFDEALKVVRIQKEAVEKIVSEAKRLKLH